MKGVILSAVALFFNYFVSIENVNKITYKNENGLVVEERIDDNKIYVSYNNMLIKSFNKESYVDAIFFDKQLYIIGYVEDAMHIYEYTDAGRLNKDVELGLSYKNISLEIINNSLYIIGNVKKNDTYDKKIDINIYDSLDDNEFHPFICRYYNDGIDSFRIYKGNDVLFCEVNVFNNHFYITGSKNQFANGDFKNGGNDKGYFIVKIDKDYNILFEQDFFSEIKSVRIKGNNILVGCLNGGYILNLEGGLINSYKFDNKAEWVFCTENLDLVSISDNVVELYDLNGNIVKYKVNIEYDDIYINNYIYIIDNNEYKRFDLVDISYFKRESIKGFDHIDDKLSGLYGEYNLIDTVYEEIFNENIHGSYNVSYLYKNDDNTIISIDGKIKVLERCNVSNGYIYPYGYSLRFTGDGNLNGKEIHSNYSLREEDNYLVLTDRDGNKSNIHFYVSRDEINYIEDDLKEYDYVCEEGCQFKYNYLVSLNDDISINSVTVNDKNIEYEYKDNTLMLKFDVSKGINYYDIEYITVKYNDKYFDIPINESIIIMGIGTEADVSCDYSIYNKYVEYDIYINDLKREERFIEFEFIDGGVIKNYLFPIGNSDINFDLDDGKEYNYSIYINGYDGMGLVRYKICDGNMTYHSDKEYFNVYLTQLNKDSTELKLIINKSRGMNNVTINSNIINMCNNFKIGPLIAGTISGICLFFGILILRKKHIIFKE